MRLIGLIPLALLAACATNSQVAKAPGPHAAAVVTSAPPAAPLFDKIDETNLVKAQTAGYKIVDDNGKKLYCRRSLVTGTRLHYATQCLTAEEFARENAATQSYVRPSPTINYTPGGGG